MIAEAEETARPLYSKKGHSFRYDPLGRDHYLQARLTMQRPLWCRVNLAGVVDDQDHSWTQGGDVAVVVLQCGDSGFVGVGDGVERLALLDLVMHHGGADLSSSGLRCGRMGSGRMSGVALNLAASRL
jgi:hypothetical protein